VDLATIADAVDALTNPIEVRERYEVWVNRNRKIEYWEHRLPSLLDQLHAAVIPGEVYVEDDAGHIRRMPQSTPPARLEAINACLVIDAGSALWVVRVGMRVRETAASNLRALVGARTDSDTAADILSDCRRWYGVAATIAGWERPPWRPDAPCPICDHRGGLRVRLERQTATCVECGEAWTPDTIGLLAGYVRGITSQPA
jgi:hypothetical protein